MATEDQQVTANIVQVQPLPGFIPLDKHETNALLIFLQEREAKIYTVEVPMYMQLVSKLGAHLNKLAQEATPS